MSMEIRPAAPDEMGQLGLLAGYVYGGSFGDGPDSMPAQATRPEWTLCGFDGGQMVTSYATIPFTMRANGNPIPLAGVSAVGTLPEYRRQGLLRRITTRSFQELYEQGRPVAALWASQAAIYQRYGYAQVTVNRAYAIDSVDIAFFDGDPGRGDVTRLDVETGYDAVKALYIDYIAERTCYLHRARVLWDNNAFGADEPDGPVHIALSRDRAGTPDAYAVYTLRGGRVDHPARPQELVVRDLAWLTLDGYRALWSWFARHDLVGRVRWDGAPVDDPAPELLVEPRMLRGRDDEGLWLRIVDVATALEARGYGPGGERGPSADGALVIEIPDDDLAPWNSGRYALTVEAGTAQVTGAPTLDPDLTLPVKALASLWAGYRTARQLRAWGLLDATPEATARADVLFATAHGPGCPDHF
jgi:predicted acetyltransferase